MKRPCDAGKWWVSLNGREVFRGHGRGPALSYASSLALVGVFEHQRHSIEVHGPQGVVWRYEEGPSMEASPDYAGSEPPSRGDHRCAGPRPDLLPAHHSHTDSGGSSSNRGVSGCPRPSDTGGPEDEPCRPVPDPQGAGAGRLDRAVPLCSAAAVPGGVSRD